ncbi:unnamed protein product, partial [Ectocarpus sp. 13 AM-2016]
SDSDSDSDGGESRDDAARAEERLRCFLVDASPLHAMALVVAAAKGRPDWESWTYTRPALLPPPGVATSCTAAAAAEGKRGGEPPSVAVMADHDGDDIAGGCGGSDEDNYGAGGIGMRSASRRTSDSWIAPQLRLRSRGVDGPSAVESAPAAAAAVASSTSLFGLRGRRQSLPAS